MSRFVHRFVIAVALVSVLGGSSLAQASRINSPVGRRQHPDRGFFAKTSPQHCGAATRTWRSLRWR